MKTESPLRTKGNFALGLAIVLILFAAFFRVFRAAVLPELPNFSPVMAIALCGALILPGWLALAVPLIALIASDIALNLQFGLAPVGTGELLRYACYGIAIASGLLLRRGGAGILPTLGAVAGNAVIFYLVTNTASWLGNPAYAQTIGGWIQSLTVGLPGYASTWTFFRNSLAGDLLFTGVFLGAMRLATLSQRQPAHA